MDQREKSGAALVALSAFGFGLMPIFAKICYGAGASTYTLLFLRFLAAAVFMMAMMRVRKLPRLSKKERWTYFFLGAIGDSAQAFCYFMALQYASAGAVSLLLYTYPAMVMVGSVFIYKEKITGDKVLSLVLATAGAFIIMGGNLDGEPLGLLLALLSALVYTTYIFYSAKFLRPGVGAQSSAYMMVGNAVTYGIISLFVGFDPPRTSPGLIGLVLITLLSTIVAFWAYMEGLGRLGPTKTSLVSLLEPLLTVLFSVIILGEALTKDILIGGCLVMASLFITVRASHKKARINPEE